MDDKNRGLHRIFDDYNDLRKQFIAACKEITTLRQQVEEKEKKIYEQGVQIGTLYARAEALERELGEVKERMKPIEEVNNKFTDDMLPSHCKKCDYVKAIKKVVEKSGK
jgi:chromosome segregation ATPase